MIAQTKIVNLLFGTWYFVHVRRWLLCKLFIILDAKRSSVRFFAMNERPFSCQAGCYFAATEMVQ